MSRKVIITVALAAACLLGLAEGALAYNAAISRAGLVSMPSSGAVTFRGGTTTVTCEITLLGSLAGSMAGIEAANRQSFGRFEGLVITNICSNGFLETALGMPWNILYTGESGALPDSMTSMSLVFQGMSVNFSVFGEFVNCLYRGETPASMAVSRTRTAGVYTTGSVRLAEATMVKISGTLCPERIGVTGTFTVSPTQTITVS